MKTRTPQLLSTSGLLRLIEEAKDAELTRNIDWSLEILRPVWPDIDSDPQIEAMEPLLQAQMLRLCGFFLTLFGRARGGRDYQIRGKDLLTRSIKIFNDRGMTDRAAEASVILALCYWHAGEIEEAEAILEAVESEFAGNELHPVYLQIRINRLMICYWKEDLDHGLRILGQLEGPMELCCDQRLVAMYHSQSGLINQKLGQATKGIFHLKEAIRVARSAGNVRFICWCLNNLAFLYKDAGEFELAYDAIDESLELARSLRDHGWMPHILDTRALIEFTQGKYDEALDTIDLSIEGFRPTEDYTGLVDSLWTRVRCLLRLGRAEDALITFSELQTLAAQKIGATATAKFARAMADEVYTPRSLPLVQEVAAFKKSRVVRALRTAGGIKSAADMLGLKNHQALSDILNKQFPEIYDELGIERRKRRSDAVKRPVKPKPLPERSFAAVRPGAYKIRLPGGYTGQVRTYYCSERMMSAVGVRGDAFVAAIPPPDEPVPGALLLYSLFDDYFLGKLHFDKLTRLFFLECPASEFPVPLGDVQIIGLVMGYMAVDALDRSGNLVFRALNVE